MIAVASLVAASLLVHVNASEHVNVVYNVACLADEVPCTKDKYDRLWKNELGWRPDDQTQLDRWMAIVRAAEARASSAPDAPLLANYLSFFPSLRQRQGLLAAALDTDLPARFRGAASQIVTPDDARALADVLWHFQTRLHPWWQRTGRGRVSGVRAIERQLTPPVRRLISQTAAFVHADRGITDVYMHVIPSPDVSNDEATGTAVRNHFFMEMVPPARPKGDARAMEMVISVAVHELTHTLYDSAPLTTHLELMRQFVDSPDRSGPALYAFLNEAIATGVQEIAGDLMRKDDAPDEGGAYRHPYIPRLGRAAMEPLRAAFAAGKTMTDGFAADYMRRGRQALGMDADSLAFRFSATALLASDPMQPAVRAFRDAVKPSFSVASMPEWQRSSELSAVFFLNYTDVPQFADRIPNLSTLLAHRGFAFITSYKSRSHVLVLSGRDADAVSDLTAE